MTGSADGFYLELFNVLLLQWYFQLCYYKNNVLYHEINYSTTDEREKMARFNES